MSVPKKPTPHDNAHPRRAVQSPLPNQRAPSLAQPKFARPQPPEEQGSEPFTCAAPKLVSKARKSATGNWSLTEIWCGPTSAHGREDGYVFPSCSNCKVILPLMLCQAKAPTPA